jgi:hypothetical protein
MINPAVVGSLCNIFFVVQANKIYSGKLIGFLCGKQIYECR